MAYGDLNDPYIDIPAGAPLGQTAVNAYQPAILNAATNATPGWSTALAQALQTASKSDLANPKTPPALGAAAIPTGRVGDPARPLKLDALVQLLEKQRAQYGTLSGQPVAQSQVLGLLGF